MTTAEKQEELIKRFGNKFYNELGDRVTSEQLLQGQKKLDMNDNTLVIAAQVTDALWKEWVEDCVHEWVFIATLKKSRKTRLPGHFVTLKPKTDTHENS